MQSVDVETHLLEGLGEDVIGATASVDERLGEPVVDKQQDPRQGGNAQGRGSPSKISPSGDRDIHPLEGRWDRRFRGENFAPRVLAMP